MRTFFQFKTNTVMDAFWLHFLNYFFFVFHTVLIIFNLFGWLVPKTRRLHFYSLVITLFSWGVLGIWYGFGYCFLTDWHYQVLRKLGETGMPNSYIAFLIEKFTGWLPGADLVNTWTLILTVAALICSFWVNFMRKK
ncbi:DUF2784 domain-containing protein [Planktosalinus lacus]|uniref:DUF2784 domain-containing protein n=1 Tax=Planktosalinus lacus TaxID=1526573 RepID=UPI001E55549C|nr:DUF2784 domain-containing protein [Planktosalinus lacus]